jgi:hypothetical protein
MASFEEVMLDISESRSDWTSVSTRSGYGGLVVADLILEEDFAFLP